MVPAAAATSSTEGPSSPQSDTGDPTPAEGTGPRSTISMSMETRPSNWVRMPATTTGAPVVA
ncbi:hypothetical protein D3C87_2148770 [compost metagenome]